MAGPAAAAAPVYVAGAALFAGAAYLLTPHGRRTSESFGEAVYDGGAQAVETITNLFSDEEEQTGSTPIATPTTTTSTQPCDGPHRGRLQVQGYNPSVDPAPIELSWPWNRPCIPPIRGEGHMALSQTLQPATIAISRDSFLWRGPAFVKMSEFIGKSSPVGYTPADSGGWSITPAGNVVRNRTGGAARNAPRVDLEIFQGRAFGTR